MKNRWMLSLLFMILLPAHLLGGDHWRTQSKPDFRFEKVTGVSRRDESLVVLLDVLQKPGARLAVRVCSKRPLAEALAVSTLQPMSISSYLIYNFNYDPERILFLRAEDCLGRDSNHAVTELWVVPQGGPLPPSVESVKACQVSLKSLPTQEGSQNDARHFRIALDQLASILRERPRSLGIVTGPYYSDGRQRSSVRRGLRQAKAFLKRKAIPTDRYLIRLEPWSDQKPTRSLELAYPAAYVIEVTDACSKQQ